MPAASALLSPAKSVLVDMTDLEKGYVILSPKHFLDYATERTTC